MWIELMIDMAWWMHLTISCVITIESRWIKQILRYWFDDNLWKTHAFWRNFWRLCQDSSVCGEIAQGMYTCRGIVQRTFWMLCQDSSVLGGIACGLNWWLTWPFLDVRCFWFWCIVLVNQGRCESYRRFFDSFALMLDRRTRLPLYHGENTSVA